MLSRILPARLAPCAVALVCCVLLGCSGTDAPGQAVGGAGAAALPLAGVSSGGTAGVGATGGSVSAGNMSGGVSGNGGANGGGSGGASAGGGTGGTGGTGGASGGASGTGGASGASAAGGSGGAAPYNPCPTNGDPCRVIPLGDSITWGAGSTNLQSYRAELFHLSLMNNKKLTFVGSSQDGPDMVDGVAFPKHHEGHSGWTIDDGGGRMGLYPQVQAWLTNTPPDIVTLMIGTNDVDIKLDPDNAPMRLGLLLDRISMFAPSALIVVAQIVPTKDDTENVRTMAYNNAILGIVKTRTDAGKHIAVADMYGAFTKNPTYKDDYMTDNLHPKDAGYTVMANTWYAAIGSLLPAK